MSQNVFPRGRLVAATLVSLFVGAGVASAGEDGSWSVNKSVNGHAVRTGSTPTPIRKVSCKGGHASGPFCAPEVGVEGAAPAIALVLGAIAVMGASRRRRV